MRDYKITSSFIAGVSWSKSTETLVVRMKNGSLYYYNLPKGYFEILIDANCIANNKRPRYGHYEFDKPGQAYNEMIKGHNGVKIHGKRTTVGNGISSDDGFGTTSGGTKDELDFRF